MDHSNRDFTIFILTILSKGTLDRIMKQAGLALPDPTMTSPENWTASCVITGNIVTALRDRRSSRRQTIHHLSDRVRERWGRLM